MKLNTIPPIWTREEIKTRDYCGHKPMVRILDGEETEEEILEELSSYAPLLLVAPPYKDPKEAWNSALTIEHICAKAKAMDVDIAVPIVAPARDDRIALVGRCTSHEPPFVVALLPEVTEPSGRVLSRFEQFNQLRLSIVNRGTTFILLLDYILGEPIEQFIKAMDIPVVWEAVERG